MFDKPCILKKTLEFRMQYPQTFYYGMTTVYYGEFNVMEYRGISWNIMEYQSISWNIMEYQWNLMKHHGI